MLMKTWNQDERNVLLYFMIKLMTQMQIWRLQWTEVCGSHCGRREGLEGTPWMNQQVSLSLSISLEMTSDGSDDTSDASGTNILQTGKYAGCVSKEFHRILSIREPTEHHFVWLQNFSDKHYWQASQLKEQNSRGSEKSVGRRTLKNYSLIHQELQRKCHRFTA